MSGWLDRLTGLRERATDGPWVENGTLLGPGGTECDASDEDCDNWVTFKTGRADEDRALFIAAANLWPLLVATSQAAEESCLKAHGGRPPVPDCEHPLCRSLAALRAEVEKLP